jgi:cytochrome c
VVREPGEAVESLPAPEPDEQESELPISIGQQAFAMCSGCHVAEEGAASTAGPNLFGVVGRQAGALEDFEYSDAMKGSGITWDEASLDSFLANPGDAVPGTSMVAGAVGDDERRAAIITYLSSLSQ